MQGSGSNFEPVPVDIYNHIAVILNSSGTTGLPKGVALTHANIMSSIVFVQETVLKLSPIPRKDRFILGIIPWFHAFGFLTTFAICVTAEATLVALPKFEEGLFLSCIENYRTSIIFMVPPLMVFLAKSPMVDNYDISSLKEIIVGAAPLKASTELAVKKRIGNNLCVRQGFGMSELTLATTIQKNIFKPGSVGDLNPGQWAKVVDEEGRTLGPHEPGELLVKGTQRMHSYIGNDKATRDTITSDGWLRTGDVAYYDEDDQFFIIDRLKELIKYKGFQVPPAEIEGLLLKHPSIKDAAVIGIPDEEAGELPMAFVVRQPNTNISEQEVFDFIAKQASKPKHLTGGVVFIDEIPKNLSGKILRRELREIAKSRIQMKSKL
jgi:acyl-CoA synthetase (AMP-forming)/AMP-acid ligase II